MVTESMLYNTNLESLVLGEILSMNGDKEGSEQKRHIKSLSKLDFYHEGNKLIFGAILSMMEKGTRPDTAGVVLELQKRKELDSAGGVMVVTGLTERIISTACIGQHIRELRELAKKRAMQKSAEQFLQELASGEKSAEQLRLDAVQLFSSIPKEYYEQERSIYINSFAGNRVAELLEEIGDNTKNKPIKTGIEAVDQLLDGGLYAGLYVVGAISSLGKTTLCLQIADQIAASGTSVLIFSLEMATKEIMEKSWSRGVLRECWSKYGKNNNNLAKSTRDISTGQRWELYSDEEKNLIFEAAADYEKYGQQINIIEGVGDIGVKDIRAAIEKHIYFMGHAPVVFIDYLQILAPHNERATDKQNTDKAVLELKKISRDFSIPVVVISSFNRDNYSQPVNMAAYKEAGSVEYSADVAIALQYDGMDYDQSESGDKDRKRAARIRDLVNRNIAAGKRGDMQRIQFKVLKNRNGSKGDTVLGFWPKYNYFEGVANGPAKNQGMLKF